MYAYFIINPSSSIILFVDDNVYIYTYKHMVLVVGFIAISSVVSFKAWLKLLCFYYCCIYSTNWLVLGLCAHIASNFYFYPSWLFFKDVLCFPLLLQIQLFHYFFSFCGYWYLCVCMYGLGHYSFFHGVVVVYICWSSACFFVVLILFLPQLFRGDRLLLLIYYIYICDYVGTILLWFMWLLLLLSLLVGFGSLFSTHQLHCVAN